MRRRNTQAFTFLAWTSFVCALSGISRVCAFTVTIWKQLYQIVFHKGNSFRLF
ncbi:hypothetical protein P4L01_24340 [Bacillus cereus]|nr:hypothetical protein [Bacillus thuringiensis]MRB06351.1 hypothetical protein [Bacillus thuringiensis]MRC50485.1 hypothetical protein [Bacillus thuringiensis]MRD28605.1 hypothetical protein [Bacillus thuringiensis]